MREVYDSTELALRWQWYDLEDGRRVDLSRHLTAVPSARWLGRHAAGASQAPRREAAGLVEPPLIVVDAGPVATLERLCARAGEALRGHPLCVAVEVTDFLPDGSLDLGPRTSSDTKQNLLVRSDFRGHAQEAANGVRYDGLSAREQMTSERDPRVFACPGVTLFRGEREDGFPFLPEPRRFTSIAYSMSCARPVVTQAASGRGGAPAQWYASEVEQSALLQRLCLIAQAALEDRRPGDSKPVLILSAAGLTEGGMHPRDAVANSLKHLRNRFSGLFHTMLLACGPDEELAEFCDKAINRRVYGGAVAGHTRNFADWHWEENVVSLHVNSVDFLAIGAMHRASMGPGLRDGRPRSLDGDRDQPEELPGEVPAGWGLAGVPAKSTTSRSQRRPSVHSEFREAMEDARSRREAKDETDLAVEDLFEEAELRSLMDDKRNAQFQKLLDAGATGTLSAVKRDLFLARHTGAVSASACPAGEAAHGARDGAGSPPWAAAGAGAGWPGASGRGAAEGADPAGRTRSARSSSSGRSPSGRRRSSYLIAPGAGRTAEDRPCVLETVSSLMARAQNRSRVRGTAPVWQQRHPARSAHIDLSIGDSSISRDGPSVGISERDRLRNEARERLLLRRGAPNPSVTAQQPTPRRPVTARPGAARPTRPGQVAAAAKPWRPAEGEALDEGATSAGGESSGLATPETSRGPASPEPARGDFSARGAAGAATGQRPGDERLLQAELCGLAGSFVGASEKYWHAPGAARARQPAALGEPDPPGRQAALGLGGAQGAWQ